MSYLSTVSDKEIESRLEEVALEIAREVYALEAKIGHLRAEESQLEYELKRREMRG